MSLNRHEAEDVIRNATGGQFPESGQTLLRTDRGWVFGFPRLFLQDGNDYAEIYIESNELRIRFADGTVKTLTTNP